MATAKVLLYIAMSLDGYIARKNDDISWLEPYQTPEEDYGYSAFINTVGSAIMGSRTYQQSLEHPERLLRGLKTYVLSRQHFLNVPDAEVEFFSGEPEALVEKIRKESDKNIYVVGGGQVVSSFLKAGLMDELCLFIVPILLGGEVSLFSTLDREFKLRLREVISYKSGIVQVHYSLVK